MSSLSPPFPRKKKRKKVGYSGVKTCPKLSIAFQNSLWNLDFVTLCSFLPLALVFSTYSVLNFLSLYEWTFKGQLLENRLSCIFQAIGSIILQKVQNQLDKHRSTKHKSQRNRSNMEVDV